MHTYIHIHTHRWVNNSTLADTIKTTEMIERGKIKVDEEAKKTEEKCYYYGIRRLLLLFISAAVLSFAC